MASDTSSAYAVPTAPSKLESTNQNRVAQQSANAVRAKRSARFGRTAEDARSDMVFVFMETSIALLARDAKTG
ncbi:hypothetical protein CE91St30_28730 [Raoultibacter timonensis]|uniref:Uncharacterized protein n=1 Tax=Raoultibacter timonensis TaxID=1907662 RepID=A0ABM7WMC7_9ACTN|nr:hypothetical protein CE91St30_28730 [Raoultibacter timonensis]BDF52143.1 hypothetical protein CE91St31_28730 [Raoultibacter timonensis]